MKEVKKLGEIYNKWTPRETQTDAFDFVTEAIKDHDAKYIMLDLPVGSGKSLLAMMIAKWYNEEYNKGSKIDVITNSIILQKQYLKDFPFLAKIWGKEKYDCDSYESTCDVGHTIQKLSDKGPCPGCPWNKDRLNYLNNSNIGICNFHLFSMWNLFLPGITIDQKNARLLIIDEAHEFENVYTDFISATVSKKDIEKLTTSKRQQDKEIAKLNNEVESVEDLKFLLERFENMAGSRVSALRKELRLAGESPSSPLHDEIKKLSMLVLKWKSFRERYEESGNWIMEKEEVFDKKGKGKYTTYHAKPIWSDDFLKEVWDRYDHVIFMSGTILDPHLFGQMNGVDFDRTAYKSQDSVFPKENRKIYFAPNIGKMSYKEKARTIERMIPVINEILDNNKDYKGIIHTGNYENANYLKDNFRDPRLLFYNTGNRNQLLLKHFNEKENPTVLVGPSMMSGVDLKNEYSRFQIILKVPYPNMTSEKVKKRMEDKTRDWYSWITISHIIQAYGRSIRSADDWALTYILDKNFDYLLSRTQHMVPDYVKEAIIDI